MAEAGDRYSFPGHDAESPPGTQSASAQSTDDSGLLSGNEGACSRLMIEFDILTLFPGLCEGAFSVSMLGKAQENRLIRVGCLDLRQWATGKHRVTDEPPYGGGPGMVLKAEPIFAAVEAIRRLDSHVILMSAAGQRFTQQKARELAERTHLIFVCGHYEGVDQRVADHLVDEELSIGDYVLTNGAIAAAVVVDAVSRMVPGVLGESQSAVDESFADGMLEYPQYTRPAEFRGWKVPEVLLSGNHAAINAWRKREAERRTGERQGISGHKRVGRHGSAHGMDDLEGYCEAEDGTEIP